MTEVLYVLPFGQPGGAEAMVRRLLRGLPEFDARVVIMGDGPFAEMLRGDDMSVEVLSLEGKAGVLRCVGAARRIAHRYRSVDVVHATGTKGAIFGVLLGRRLKVPVVWLKPDHFFDGRVARAIARRCDRVVCVSDCMASQFLSDLGDRVSVIYPGVDVPEDVVPIGSEQLIVAAGRLDPLKGFDHLIRSVAVLRERGIDARLRIAGPDDRMHPGYHVHLDDLIATLGLGNAVEILGWVDDYDAFLNGGRVLATASKPPAPGRPSEAAPTVLMEAMARARPVVAQEEGGTQEVVGQAGTLVGQLTPERLADALQPYLGDRRLATETGLRGRERARRLFDQEITVARFRQIFEDLSESA